MISFLFSLFLFIDFFHRSILSFVTVSKERYLLFWTPFFILAFLIFLQQFKSVSNFFLEFSETFVPEKIIPTKFHTKQNGMISFLSLFFSKFFSRLLFLTFFFRGFHRCFSFLPLRINKGGRSPQAQQISSWFVFYFQ